MRNESNEQHWSVSAARHLNIANISEEIFFAVQRRADATSIKEVVPTREDDVWRGGPSPTKGSFNVHANPKMNRRSIDYGITKQQSLIIVPTSIAATAAAHSTPQASIRAILPLHSIRSYKKR